MPVIAPLSFLVQRKLAASGFCFAPFRADAPP